MVFRILLAGSTLFSTQLLAAEVDARPPDRLIAIGSKAQLSGADDGWGGSLSWLHFFTPDTAFSLGAEHQKLADAHWTFGSVRGSWSHGESASKFNISGEVNLGSGTEARHDFDYSIAALSLSQSFTRQFSVQFESRQIDIDTTHGNLPKLGVTYLWTPLFVTSVAYARSVGGNLGTELTTARIDSYGRHINFLIGAATGHADPSVINLFPGVHLPARNLKEGFAGIGKVFSGGEVQLLGDYIELADSRKTTISLSFSAYFGHAR
jgi:hypothetical protein